MTALVSLDTPHGRFLLRRDTVEALSLGRPPPREVRVPVDEAVRSRIEARYRRAGLLLDRERSGTHGRGVRR